MQGGLANPGLCCVTVMLCQESDLRSKVCMEAGLEMQFFPNTSTFCRAGRHPGLVVVHRHFDAAPYACNAEVVQSVQCLQRCT